MIAPSPSSVTGQLSRAWPPPERVTELGEQRGDHLVVGRELRDHGAQRRMARRQLGEQGRVLAAVVPAERGAKPVAVEQEVGGRRAGLPPASPGVSRVTRSAWRSR